MFFLLPEDNPVDEANNMVDPDDDEDMADDYHPHNSHLKIEPTLTSPSQDSISDHLKKPKQNNLPQDLISLQKRLYEYQIQVAEEETAMRLKKMKREEYLLEQQHQSQMALLEKEHELAQTKIEYWSHH